MGDPRELLPNTKWLSGLLLMGLEVEGALAQDANSHSADDTQLEKVAVLGARMTEAQYRGPTIHSAVPDAISPTWRKCRPSPKPWPACPTATPITTSRTSRRSTSGATPCTA